MELTLFIDTYRAAFGSSIKLVEDLCRFLDISFFRELSSYSQHERNRLVALYLEWFHELCAVCLQVGVPLPPLISEIAQWKTNLGVRSIATSDYQKLVVHHAMNEVGPSALVHVLIVDDMPTDISKSFRALRGWQNIVLDVLHVRSKFDEEETDASLCERVAKDIVARAPQIVLMDYGLPLSNGADIVNTVRALNPRMATAFVANTGGDPTLLNEAGAFENFDKGKYLWVIRQVLKNFA